MSRFGLMLLPDASVSIESSNSMRTPAEPPNAFISGSTTPIEALEFPDVDIAECISHRADISSSFFDDEIQGSDENTSERDADESESGSDSSTNTVSLQSQMNATTLQDDDYLPPFNAIATGLLLYSTKYISSNTSL